MEFMKIREIIYWNNVWAFIYICNENVAIYLHQSNK